MVANAQFSELLEVKKSVNTDKCRVSSAVEQRFCKPLVGSSILSPGTKISGKYKWLNRASADDQMRSISKGTQQGAQQNYGNASWKKCSLISLRPRGYDPSGAPEITHQESPYGDYAMTGTTPTRRRFRRRGRSMNVDRMRDFIELLRSFFGFSEFGAPVSSAAVIVTAVFTSSVCEICGFRLFRVGD